MKKLILSSIVFTMLAACTPEEAKDAVGSFSPDRSVRLSVSGKRDSPVSPWVTTLTATGRTIKGNVSFEFYGSEISSKTISFVWEKNRTCIITFTERDGTKRIFLFNPKPGEPMWTDQTEK